MEKELSELGYMQAVLLAKRLSKIKFEEIIVSDSRRTLKTSDEIFKLLENKINTKYVVSKIVREKNSGILEGKSIGRVKSFVQVIYYI